ncbi:unnamed protein product [Pocillopora meandrina]|uniref:TIR domain-containing protein n=1 Tax=Pocillopora meandrina TaxID=46732 RepID=A0AAU9VW90_9CNID|nr:unnamed protein product [Pocillopora meandrina]
MSKSFLTSVPFIDFFWGYVFFVHIQCRGTLGIPTESKLPEFKELCFRRCDIGLHADDKGISSKEMSSFEACFERCLSEKGELSAISNDQKALTNKEKTAPFKRTRRDASSHTASQNSVIKYGFDCYNGSANSTSPAMIASGVKIMFQELNGTKGFQGKISWKPLQNDGVTWTKYKIISVYMASNHVECTELDKKVTTYTITDSSHGIMNNSEVYVLVASYPHSNDLARHFDKFLWCKVPNACQDSTTTPPPKDYSKALSPTSDLITPTPLKDPPTTPSPKDYQRIMIFVPVFVTSSVLAVVTLLAFLYYRRRKNYESPNPLTDLKFEYDAFIIYSSYDSEWVVKTLLPTLEEKHGLKCCVHYRDFTLGIPIRQNMVDSVYRCKKTVAVVSTNFFNSSYCGSELDYALHRLMEKKDDSLVVIKLDNVDRNKLPKELQSRSYIDYPKSIEKETWEKKLVKCLKVIN